MCQLTNKGKEFQSEGGHAQMLLHLGHKAYALREGVVAYYAYGIQDESLQGPWEFTTYNMACHCVWQRYSIVQALKGEEQACISSPGQCFPRGIWYNVFFAKTYAP